MENERSANSYEDARKQRLLENRKRIEDLGLLKLSKSLSDLKKSEKSQHRHARPKPAKNYLIEPRRSSRARNSVPSYRDDETNKTSQLTTSAKQTKLDFEPHSLRKRSKSNSSWTSYLARPVEEVKVATYEERDQAYKCAEKFQGNLQNGNPSFVKSMVRSHVYSCFWLGLPNKFCEDHLPKSTVNIVLEDEEGSEYEAVFISKRTGLSGGWRAFALDHKLDDGDALVFELTEPTRFKVHIVRAFDCEDCNGDLPAVEVGSDVNETARETRRGEKNNHQTKNSTKSKKEKSLQVSAPRSLRKR